MRCGCGTVGCCWPKIRFINDPGCDTLSPPRLTDCGTNGSSCVVVVCGMEMLHTYSGFFKRRIATENFRYSRRALVELNCKDLHNKSQFPLSQRIRKGNLTRKDNNLEGGV